MSEIKAEICIGDKICVGDRVYWITGIKRTASIDDYTNLVNEEITIRGIFFK